jgi:hypothetical protein
VYRSHSFFLVLGTTLALAACSGESRDKDDASGGQGSGGTSGGSGGGGGLGAAGGAGTGGSAGGGGFAGSASGGTAGLDPSDGGEGGAAVELLGDEDSDGISNADEGSDVERDTDADGTPDYLDTDSDGDSIPDGVEAGDDDPTTKPTDTDLDKTPDYIDLDSDDDGTSDKDEVEKNFDSDGDLIPDYRDEDSDNDDLDDKDERKDGLDPLDSDSDDDGIGDGDEGTEDDDGDGVMNALDDDSDDDGTSDADEAGDDSDDTPPVDTDFDGTPDFLDLDSDGDGLPDKQEEGCGRGVIDGDDDGYGDLAEVSIGSDPCDDGDTVKDHGVEFFFILPYESPEQQDELRFVPTVKKADVFFNVDTTGSMNGVITSLKSGLSTIITTTRTRVTDSAFGVAEFEDYPVTPFGSSGDAPFTLLSGLTGDTTVAQTATNQLTIGGGNDGPEAGYEALFQAADGSGVSGTAGTFGPFKATGRIGGAQFRPLALPIIVHATDAESHDLVATAGNPAYDPAFNAHGREDALAALRSIGARVITIQNGIGAAATTQLTEVSQVTRAVVPVCSFKTTETEWRCGANQCCLPGAVAPTDGKCVLRYGINNDGSGLADVAADGIDAIIKYTKFDVFAETRDDGESATPDTSAFLTRVEANTPDDDFKPPLEPEFSCNPVPVPAAFDGSTYDNGFEGFAVGSSSTTREGAKLFFTVRARNTTVPETDEPQLFSAFIDIVDEQTGAVLDTQDVVVIVPAVPGAVGE